MILQEIISASMDNTQGSNKDNRKEKNLPFLQYLKFPAYIAVHQLPLVSYNCLLS